MLKTYKNIQLQFNSIEEQEEFSYRLKWLANTHQLMKQQKTTQGDMMKILVKKSYELYTENSMKVNDDIMKQDKGDQ